MLVSFLFHGWRSYSIEVAWVCVSSFRDAHTCIVYCKWAKGSATRVTDSRSVKLLFFGVLHFLRNSHRLREGLLVGQHKLGSQPFFSDRLLSHPHLIVEFLNILVHDICLFFIVLVILTLVTLFITVVVIIVFILIVQLLLLLFFWSLSRCVQLV